MSAYRIVAIPTETAAAVRATGRSPRYGHPAHRERASGYGPCRHCLRTFRIGEEERILFTLDAFEGQERLPLPGPVFIHAEPCERYPEDAGFPRELLAHPLTLDAYAPGRVLRAQVHARGEDAEEALARLMESPEVAYVHVRDTSAGCYDFRVERAPSTPDE